MVEKRIADDEEALAMFREATTGAKHIHKPDADNISISNPKHGTSRKYLLERLKGERPDLYDPHGEVRGKQASVVQKFGEQTILRLRLPGD